MRHGIIETYRQYLPDVTEKTPIVSLCEGNTPLIESPRMAAWLGLPSIHLFLKFEGMNPTGSFKDRGMTMAVSKAKEEGAQVLLCASTGNTSAAAAAYGARAGIPVAVLLPKGEVALGKLSQALIHGAKALMIDGNFDDALRLVREIAQPGNALGIQLVNSINPYRLEGQKSVSWETVDALGDAPEIHAMPVGNAGNITACWRGYKIYKDAGISTHLPKMLGFQAWGAAPIVDGAVVESPQTIATAIRIGNPATWHGAIEAREESGGLVDKVTDEQILEAYAAVAAKEGVFAEPACAAPLAGLKMLAARGWFRENGLEEARVVVTLTGHGLKDPDRAIKTSGASIDELPADRDSVLSAIGAVMAARQ